MNQPNQAYFQLRQAQEVAEVFAKYNVEFLFIGKSGAALLGYPAAMQKVVLFPEKSVENGKKLVVALRELEFEITKETAEQIIRGVDFVQLKQGPFDLDLVFAPDGIESYAEAKKRMIVIDGFPVANIRDIIASKKASGRKKDLNDLPLLEDFRQELEKKMRGVPKSAVEMAMKKLKKSDG